MLRTERFYQPSARTLEQSLLWILADELDSVADTPRFAPYQFDPTGYINKFLHWTPWGEQERVITAYTLALQQQQERHDFERGDKVLGDLKYWQPGQVIKNWIRVESGNLVGKTKLSAGLVSHFFDCYPSIIYTFAPSSEQLNLLLWKEIRTDRIGRDLTGTVLEGEARIKDKANHFVVGRVTDNSGGGGIERLQGQHHTHLMFVLDEADGIPDFVYDAIEGMDAGVMVIVLMVGNPRSQDTRFYRTSGRAYVQNFRISTLDHPNVIENRPVIPGGATREWVERRIEAYTEIVEAHSEDEFTFEVPWHPSLIYRPLPEFFWRVLGIAPSGVAEDVFCPVGRYEAATKRDRLTTDNPTIARLGIDVARYGDDMGTLYVKHHGQVWRAAQFAKLDYYDYYLKTKEVCKWLIELGVVDIQIRVDAGGGFGGGVVSHLLNDIELSQRQGIFEKLVSWDVKEVNFNANSFDREAYANLITEMYAHAGESLKVLRLHNPPNELRDELCKRHYKYGKLNGYDVKVLTDKERFRKLYRRSPDDADGLVLALAPDYLFGSTKKLDNDQTHAEQPRWNRSRSSGGRWR